MTKRSICNTCFPKTSVLRLDRFSVLCFIITRPLSGYLNWIGEPSTIFTPLLGVGNSINCSDGWSRTNNKIILSNQLTSLTVRHVCGFWRSYLWLSALLQYLIDLTGFCFTAVKKKKSSVITAYEQSHCFSWSIWSTSLITLFHSPYTFITPLTFSLIGSLISYSKTLQIHYSIRCRLHHHEWHMASVHCVFKAESLSSFNQPLT